MASPLPPPSRRLSAKAEFNSRSLKSLGCSLLGRLAFFLIPLEPTPSLRTQVSLSQSCNDVPWGLGALLFAWNAFSFPPPASLSPDPRAGCQGTFPRGSGRPKDSSGLWEEGWLWYLSCPCSSQPLGCGVLRPNPVPGTLNNHSSLLTPKFKMVALFLAP